MNIPHTNFDAVFKESLTLFKDKTLDFLGLAGVAPIVESLGTESVEIDMTWELRDLSRNPVFAEPIFSSGKAANVFSVVFGKSIESRERQKNGVKQFRVGLRTWCSPRKTAKGCTLKRKRPCLTTISCASRAIISV